MPGFDPRRGVIPQPAVIVCDPADGSWSALSGRLAGHGVVTHTLHLAGLDPTRAMVGLVDRYQGPIHLVGRGIGAAIVLDAALRRVQKVASLTLVDPHALQLLRATAPSLSGRMRLEVLRVLPFPMLFIETVDAVPAVATITRRMHAAARPRRGRHQLVGRSGLTATGTIWPEVAEAVADRIVEILPPDPVMLAHAA